MKQYDFTKEEMNFIIDRLKGVCSNSDIIKENFSAAECMEFRLKTFLDIIKDVFVNNIPFVQTTNQEQKEGKFHKYRLFSVYGGGESLDWIEITDEQIRLLEYLQNGNFLDDDIDFEECEAENFKRI